MADAGVPRSPPSAWSKPDSQLAQSRADYATDMIVQFAVVAIPSYQTMMQKRTVLERHIALLRVIEALRMYAATNNDTLPNDLTEYGLAPIPNDPMTGQPFGYSVEGATFQLQGEPHRLDAGEVRLKLHYSIEMRKNPGS